jgi:hypothetical protein
MADKKLDQRTRQWTQPAGRAITYGPFARLADWWCASRDARIVLPHLLLPTSGGPGQPDADQPDAFGWPAGAAAWVPPAAWDTPRTRFLGQLGRGRAETEWLRYQKSVAGYLVGRARAMTNRDAAGRELAAARQRLDQLTAPGAGEAAARRSGEDNTGLSVVASRRRREFAEERAAAEAEVKRWSAELTEHDLMVAELSEPVRMRFEVAKHRAELIDAYVWRRRASYLTWLVRKHDDGSEASSLLRSGWPERPAWAARPASPDLTAPDLADPGLAQPGLAQTAPAQPDLTAPDLAQRGPAQPDLTGHDLSGTDLSEPDLSGPSAEPGVTEADPAEPRLAEPRLAEPHLSGPRPTETDPARTYPVESRLTEHYPAGADRAEADPAGVPGGRRPLADAVVDAGGA